MPATYPKNSPFKAAVSRRRHGMALLICAAMLLPSLSCYGKNGAGTGFWGGKRAVEWLGTAVAEQETYLARLTSLSMTMTERGIRRDGRRIHERNLDHTEYEKGPCLRIERSGTVPENLGRGRRGSVYRSESLVLNHQYLARAHPPGTVAFLREHSSIETMSEQSSGTLKAFEAQGPRRYGFGNGHDTLAQIYRRLQTEDQLRLRVKRLPGPENLYALHFSYRKNPLFEMVLDGNHGFLTLEATHYGPGGFLSEKISVTSAEIAPGLSFPSKWARTTFDPLIHKPGASHPTVTTFYDITEIELNPELDDSLFTWQTLPLGPAGKISYYDSTGRLQTFDIVDGELLPESPTSEPISAETADRQASNPLASPHPPPESSLGSMEGDTAPEASLFP